MAEGQENKGAKVTVVNFQRHTLSREDAHKLLDTIYDYFDEGMAGFAIAGFDWHGNHNGAIACNDSFPLSFEMLPVYFKEILEYVAQEAIMEQYGGD